MTADEARDVRRREAAVRVALKTGLLKRCPAHGTVYDPGQHDYQGACMVATFLVNAGNPAVADYRGDRDALTALLKTICAGYAHSCPQCGPPAAG